VPVVLGNWIVLIVLGVVWGSSFILMKLGMYASDGSEVFADHQVASLRISIAGIALAPIALRHWRKITSWKTFLLLSVVGFAGNFFPAFLFTYAETALSSGYAGMLNSFTPIFALILGFLIFKDRLTWIQLVGVAIGTVGIVALTLSGGNLSNTGNVLHVGAIVLANLFYAISVTIIKHTLQGLRSFEITALSFFIILWPSLIITGFNGSFETLQSNPDAKTSLIYIGILSLIGTAFAVFLFNILIARSSILFASSVTYLIPITAVLIGLSFQEEINSMHVTSMMIILAGVFAANVIPKLKQRKSVATK